MAQQHNIGCIIISNADDLCFLEGTLRQAANEFAQIVIATGSKLWNGEEEDLGKIQAFQNKHKHLSNVEFVTYNVPTDKIDFMANQVTPSMYWEGHARWVALEKLKLSCEYVLFIDADEVVDGRVFRAWLDTGIYKRFDAMKLANYWYWRLPVFRAQGYLEDSAVLIKRTAINPFMLFSNHGRHGVFEACRGSLKAREVKDHNGEVMIHHYSWVRSKDAMLRKVKNWGHRDDRTDWVAMVNKEFESEVTSTHTDFLKGLRYQIVADQFGLMQS